MTATTVTAVDARSLVDLEAEIVTIGTTIAHHRTRLIRLVGEFDLADGWVASGAISCAHWLADLLDLELSTAREQVRVARALRVLPETSKRFGAGEVSYAKVRQLTRVATPDNEAQALAIAKRCPSGQLAHALAEWHRSTDPEAAEQRSHDERGMSVRILPTGNRLITVELPVDQAALLETAVDREVMSAPAGASGCRDSLRQQRADGFVRLVRHTLDAPAGASRGTPRVELVLHRRVGQTMLDDGTVLADSLARRLTCDADVRVMAHDPDGSPADVGRRHRFVTPRLRRLALERAGGRCEHPGCRARHFLDVHHTIHWLDGGATDLANLRVLCAYHHRLHHSCPLPDAGPDSSSPMTAPPRSTTAHAAAPG